jgi:protoheme IX farnesyltransferase
LFWLIIGGFLTTASANGFNQIIERDLDKLMNRTAGRPIPDARMSVKEGVAVGLISGALGVGVLAWFLNIESACLGFLSVLLYTLAYTPMKRHTPFSVFVGAIPGAIPPLLGWVAATGAFSLGGWVLFSIQFLWQFPHFWSIAWVLDEDYKKAGFKMLPSGERNKDSAVQALFYSFSLIPLGIMPYVFGLSGWISAWVAGLAGLVFFLQSWKLFSHLDLDHARKLMFGSFVYLPLVQLILYIDKV